MKLAWRDIKPFVTRPDPAMSLVLVYGPDQGLVQERTGLILPHYVSDAGDPLAVTSLSAGKIADEPSIFWDESQSVSLLGPSKRVLKITDADDDKIAPILQEYLNAPNPDICVIAIGGNLGPRSALRKLAETKKNAVALPCYVDDKGSLQDFIREFCQENGFTADRDALAYLSANLVGDRLLARRQMEKLILYMGQTRQITYGDAQEAIPDLSLHTLDDVVYAAFEKRWPELYRALDMLWAENVSFMMVLRSLQNHMRRLDKVQRDIAKGTPAAQAMKELNPPVFFKLEDSFKRHLNLWPAASLDKLQSDLLELETQLKTYGADMTAPLFGQWLLQHMSLAKAA